MSEKNRKILSGAQKAKIALEAVMERPRRRTLQTLPSKATSWLKLANKLKLNTNVI